MVYLKGQNTQNKKGVLPPVSARDMYKNMYLGIEQTFIFITESWLRRAQGVARKPEDPVPHRGNDGA